MTTHAVTLIFEDGRIVKFDASEDDNIYFAALKNRVRILTDCLEGACATCKGICTQGTYYLDEYTPEALTQDEAGRREVLTCRMHATSDCVIEFPYESKIALRSAPESEIVRVKIPGGSRTPRQRRRLRSSWSNRRQRPIRFRLSPVSTCTCRYRECRTTVHTLSRTLLTRAGATRFSSRSCRKAR